MKTIAGRAWPVAVEDGAPSALERSQGRTHGGRREPLSSGPPVAHGRAHDFVAEAPRVCDQSRSAVSWVRSERSYLTPTPARST